MLLNKLNPEFSGLGVITPSPPQVLSLYAEIPFGKLKGMEVKSAIDNDSKYMQWFSDNIERYVLSTEARTYLRQTIEYEDSERDNDYYGNINFGDDDIPW